MTQTSQIPPLPNQSMWHYQMGAQQLGPVPLQNLIPMIQNATITSSTLVWSDPMPQWAAAGTVPQLAPYFNASANQSAQSIPEANSKKTLAGLLAIFLGTFGIHKFVLGYTTAGVVTILISVLTCFLAAPIMHIIGIIEGIIYLSKNDQDFYNTYMVNKKPWF